jgi:hypothetical protein
VALAAEITAWMQMLAFAGADPGSQADAARRWEPNRLRYRIFTIGPPSLGPGDGPGCTCPPDHRGPR